MSLKDTLICAVCDSVFHNPVALLDCNHHFCGACISRWFKDSNSCPVCRKAARKAVPGHTIQQVVEFYLESNPSERKTVKEIRGMDRIYRAGDEVQVRHGRELPPAEDDEDESDAESVVSSVVEERNQQWWASQNEAMESNEDLLAFIEQQSRIEETRRRELLGEIDTNNEDPPRQQGGTAPATPGGLRGGGVGDDDNSGNIIWEPCKHCHSPSPLHSPISEIRPGFTCPDPLEDIYDFPLIKGMILQNHGKCSSCSSTFPIVDEQKKDYICEFCDSFWCGNVDNCGSSSLKLVNCAAPASFFTHQIALDILGTHELNSMMSWMYDDVLWDADPLDWTQVGQMIIVSLTGDDGFATLKPGHRKVVPRNTWACVPCMRGIVEGHILQWWARKKEEYGIDDKRRICYLGFSCPRRRESEQDGNHGEEFNHLIGRLNNTQLTHSQARPSSFVPPRIPVGGRRNSLPVNIPNSPPIRVRMGPSLSAHAGNVRSGSYQAMPGSFSRNSPRSPNFVRAASSSSAGTASIHGGITLPLQENGPFASPYPNPRPPFQSERDTSSGSSTKNLLKSFLLGRPR